MEYKDDLDDEIDLVKLVTTSADVTNQYIIFEGSNAEYYAINVAKVEELFVYQKERLVHNNKNALIMGTTDIRSHMTPIVCFDAWFGNVSMDESNYELLIFCYFSSEYLGLLVKQVVDILTIMPHQMQSSSRMNELTTFIAKINIANAEYLCTIFDADKLLFDMYGNAHEYENAGVKPIESDKFVLFADDSQLIRKMAQSTFEKLGVRFKIFSDGAELIAALPEIKTQEIGLFLLDLEMPGKSGLDVIDYVKTQTQYVGIPIIIHTNMANSSIKDSLNARNVTKIIGKVDFKTIESAMREYIL